MQAVISNERCRIVTPTREGHVGRAWDFRAKTVVWDEEPGAPQNHIGVEASACMESWFVNWGDPPVPRGVVEHQGSTCLYKAETEIRWRAEEVGRAHSTNDRRDNITRRREGTLLR